MTFMQLENKFENDATTHISMIDKLIIYFNIRNQVYSSSVDFYCPENREFYLTASFNSVILL